MWTVGVSSGSQGIGGVMELNTMRFGRIKIKDQEIITLPEGLIGFPELSRFALLRSQEADNSPFTWLQSLDDGSMAFVVCDPDFVRPDFKQDLELSLDDQVLAVVTIPQDPKKITANLKAPIVFNKESKTGKQIILKNDKYSTRHFIEQEREAHREVDCGQGAKGKTR